MISDSRAVEVAGRKIGPGEPCFIIAEAGCNHDGSLSKALQLIDVAAQAGVDAVKFQTFDADLLATEASPKAAYQLETTDAAESQHAMLRKLQLPRESFAELAAHARGKGLMFLSTPFDEVSASVLASLNVPAFKLGSGELTHLPFLDRVARYGRPMLVSTGMARLSEIEDAIGVIRQAGNPDVALFHAVSCYPADPADVNLRAMETMRRAFGVPVGYSDHTIGNAISVAAVALGACMIEKHFTLDRLAAGPDHRASAGPAELTALVQEIRSVERALGHGRKIPAAAEADTRRVARRSVVAIRPIAAGKEIARADLDVLRPGTGLEPRALPLIVGRRARTAIERGMLLSWDMIA